MHLGSIILKVTLFNYSMLMLKSSIYFKGLENVNIQI